ncbi:MAG TPA: helix-turn-helix domain-containing protein [Pyrinomonadaceae bacterium]|nr:helix-turn-helix domain-containing protein [Acidobacteriota bacterium]HQY68728.1 helix-turn-helix domain-containing protein [Pyrinomonadaceae bacterium]
MNNEFILRLNRAFDHASMADVARRLGIPHATVRNYYQGRMPAPEVLIKIANETNVSLNWLLIGTGDMYAGQTPKIGLGRFIEDRIGEFIDEKLAALRSDGVVNLGSVDVREEFDVEAALEQFGDPQSVMNEWFRYEGRECPQDYGVVFFRGWETFSVHDRIAAIRDAKRVLDRSLASK